MAGFVGMLAGLVARRQFEHAQRQFGRVGADRLRRVEGELAARCFRG
jgi:hypothetical protein